MRRHIKLITLSACLVFWLSGLVLASDLTFDREKASSVIPQSAPRFSNPNIYQSYSNTINQKNIEMMAFVINNIKFDPSVSAINQQKIIDSLTQIFMTGRADYLMEALDYTTFKIGNATVFYPGTNGGTVEILDPADIPVLVHEFFHSFWFKHTGNSPDSAMDEGFAIAAAEVVVNNETDLAEKVFGTKLYYRDIGLVGYPRDIALGADIINYADNTLANALDFLQAHDNTGSGFNWRDKSRTETYFNTIWVNLDRAREDYFSVQVPWAIEQMRKLNNEPPVRPPNPEPAAWQQYYEDYLVYINQLTDPATKATAWKTLLGDLKDALQNQTGTITSAAIKKVLDEATAFLNSADFNSLNNTEKADHIGAIIDTLTVAINKNSNIDKATLVNALEGVKTFLGSNKWELGVGFAALDNAQKQKLLEGFVALAKEIMNSNSQAVDANLRVDICTNLSRFLAVLLREQAKNGGSGLDLAQAKKDIIGIVANYVKSDGFKSIAEGQQIDILWNFNRVAIELGMRPEDNEANKEFISQIVDVFKTVLEVGTNKVQAAAINELTHLFRLTGWRNGDVAVKFLGALNISGGLNALINKFLTDVSNTSLDPNLRGDIAIALSNLMLHRNDIGRAGVQIEAANLDQAKAKVTDYLKGLNDGTINAGWWIRNGLMHIAGGVIDGIINEGTQNTDANKAFIDAFLQMVKDSLLIAGDKDGALDLRTTAINKLIGLRNTAIAKGDNALADKMKGIVLDSNFDVNDYITKAKAEMAKRGGINADSGAWFAAALTNLAQLHIAEGTGKIDAQTLKGIVISVKSWVTNQDNLDAMRWMSLQEQLFEQLKELTKQIYKKDSTFAGDKELEDALVDIFSVIPNIKDPLVKELDTKAISEDLVKYLKDNNRGDLATRIEGIFNGAPGR